MPSPLTPNEALETDTSTELKRRRLASSSHTDEFGIPISTPANYEPLAIGVKDELLCVFPRSLQSVPFALLPCGVELSLSKKVVQPQDASLLNQILSKAFRFLSNVPVETDLPEKTTKKSKKTTTPLNELDDLSTAYYKGNIPEILFAHTALPEAETALIEDLAVYAEKLLGMGFISADARRNNLLTSLNEDSAIHRAVPCVVIVGHGFLYQRFLKHFLARLSHIGHSQAERKALQKLLLGRVCRGQVISLVESSKAPVIPPIDAVQAVDGKIPPALNSVFKIAGGLNQTQRQIQQALGRHGVTVTVEHNSSNPAERIELVALNHVLQSVVMPHAYTAWEGTQKRRASLKSISHFRQQLLKTLFDIGVERHAFHSYELPVALGMPCEKGDLSVPDEAVFHFISDELRDFMPVMVDYARELQLLKDDQTLAEIASHLTQI
jgi:hypothetical protein